MKPVDVNKRLVKSYLELFKTLSPDTKLDLISGISDSLKSTKRNKNHSLRALQGDFIEEKSAEEIISDLKTARTFNRTIKKI